MEEKGSDGKEEGGKNEVVHISIGNGERDIYRRCLNPSLLSFFLSKNKALTLPTRPWTQARPYSLLVSIFAPQSPTRKSLPCITCTGVSLFSLINLTHLDLTSSNPERGIERQRRALNSIPPNGWRNFKDPESYLPWFLSNRGCNTLYSTVAPLIRWEAVTMRIQKSLLTTEN